MKSTSYVVIFVILYGTETLASVASKRVKRQNDRFTLGTQNGANLGILDVLGLSKYVGHNNFIGDRSNIGVNYGGNAGYGGSGSTGMNIFGLFGAERGGGGGVDPNGNAGGSIGDKWNIGNFLSGSRGTAANVDFHHGRGEIKDGGGVDGIFTVDRSANFGWGRKRRR